MNTLVQKNITISCTDCSAPYTIPYPSADRDTELICIRCKKHIRIIQCTQCRSFYTITYTSLEHVKYRFTCQKCSHVFTIDFSDAHTNRVPAAENKKKFIPAEKSSHHAGSDTQRIKKPFIERKKITIPPKTAREYEGIKTYGPMSSSFSIRALFLACGQAFSPARLVTAAIGTVVTLIMALSYTALIPSLLDSALLRSILFSAFAALAVFFITMASSVISRITIDRTLLNKKTGAGELLLFAGKITAPLLFSNGFVLIACNLIFFLAVKIPFVGPALFAMLFLPLYLGIVILLCVIGIGFWFYPSILAHRHTGITAAMSSLYHFIKKHNFTLIYIIPTLIITSSLVLTAVFLIHRGACILIIEGASLFTGDQVRQTFSSVPGLFVKIASFSFTAGDMNIFKGFFQDLSTAAAAGGFILGIALTVLTVMLGAIALSVVSTLSAYMYIHIERGIESRDSAFLRVLAILVLLLAAVFLFKKVYW